MTRVWKAAWWVIGSAALLPRVASAQRPTTAIVALPSGPDALADQGTALHQALVAEAQAGGMFTNVRAGAVTAPDAYMLVGCARQNAACFRHLKRALGGDRFITLTLTQAGASGYSAEVKVINLANGRTESERTVEATGGDPPAAIARRLLGLETAPSPAPSPAPTAVASRASVAPPPVRPPTPPTPTATTGGARPGTDDLPPLEPERPATVARPESIAVSPPAQREPSTPVASRGGGVGGATIALGLVGVALLGAGATLAVLRDQTQAEFNRTDNTTSAGIQQMLALQNDWNRNNLLALIGYGAGAATLAVTAVLLILDLSHGGARPETACSPRIHALAAVSPDGLAVGLGGTF